jgi:hypothetical protein
MSDTQKALEWLRENPGATPYAAAKVFRLSPSTVYRALMASGRRDRCSQCGQIMRG